MNSERTEASMGQDPSFAQVGLLRTVRVNPVVLTATPPRYDIDNSVCDGDSNHHDHHHDHHRS